MLNTRSRGFTLVELMVTVSVLAVLMAVALPGFRNWVGNAKVRSVAESLQNGMRLAQEEAMRRNRQTVFVLTNATPAFNATVAANGTNWYVRVLTLLSSETADSSYFVSGSSFGQQSGITITGPAAICFNSIGRQIARSAPGLGSGVTCAAPASATTPVTYDVSKATGTDRTLRVQVYLGGQIRMCDTAKTLSTSNPDGC